MKGLGGGLGQVSHYTMVRQILISSGLWLAGNEGMEKKMETTVGFRVWALKDMDETMETVILGYKRLVFGSISFIAS